jgi:flagellar motor switch protein FliG
MTDVTDAVPATLSGPREAAMFLMGVGDQVGMAVLRHLALLTPALKGTGAKVRERFTQCMSQRGAEMLTGDLEVRGPGGDAYVV